MTKNKSYQEINKNLQEALAKKNEREMENREKHEDKNKNCPQKEAEIKGVEQKNTLAKVESEKDTFNDDDVDVEFSYNVKTCKIFSHLQIPLE